MENYIFQVATFIKEILFKTKEKDMVNSFGLIVVFTKDNGETVFKMEKDRFILLEVILLVEFFRIVS